MKQSMKFSARTFAAWTFGVALAAAASVSNAAVLYEQQPNNATGYWSNPQFPQQIADDFTLGGAASLESITWWGGYSNVVDPDDFRVRLYSDVSGTGTVLQTFNVGAAAGTLTGQQIAGSFAEYRYDYALATPVNLAAGTYYLFVENLGTSDWLWEGGAPGNGILWYRNEDTDTWNSSVGSFSDDLAFRLNGTTQTQPIPEPGSLALLLLAGAGLGLTRRAQRQ